MLDGDAHGITELAAVRGLDIRRPLFYAGDLGHGSAREQAQAGATLVFTDSNRRGFTAASRTIENVSETLGPRDPKPPNLASYDLFRGAAAQ